MTIAKTPSNPHAAIAADAAIAAYLRALADQRAAELERTELPRRAAATAPAPLVRRRYERIDDISRTSFLDLRQLANPVPLPQLAINSGAAARATLTRGVR